MGATVQKVTDLGDDRLEVTGTVEGHDDEAGAPIVYAAYGWVSAMENHYDDDTRDDEGHRPAGATARPMTDDERLTYWRSLLAEAAGPAAASEPTVLYEQGA